MSSDKRRASGLYAAIADPSLVRRINSSATLGVLYGGGPVSLSGLVEATGLSRKTAEAVVEALVEEGLVAEIPGEAQGGAAGRPARQYRFVADAGMVLGVDIAVHRVVAVAADLTGQTLARVEELVKSTTGRQERLDCARSAVRKCISKTRLPRNRLRYVTVGTPGIVDQLGRVRICPVLPDWSDFSLKEALQADLRCEIVVENDTNLSAVGERWRGCAPRSGTSVWVLTGRRTSMGILINGELYRGDNGAAGEIGWSADLGWEEVRQQPLSFLGAMRKREAGIASAILEAAQDGEGPGLAAIEQLAKSLSRGISAVVLALNPSCVIIGGSLAEAGSMLVPALIRHMSPQCLIMPDVRASSLGTDSVSTGAVRTALDAVEADLFSTQRIQPP